MQKQTFSDRFQQAMKQKGCKQVDLLREAESKDVKLGKINKEEADYKINKLKSDMNFSDADDNYLKCVNELDNIYENSFSKVK